MAIREYGNEIRRDTHVYGPNVYLGNGQGCGTIWFRTVPAAYRALKKDGIKYGADLFDCTKCDCHYSWHSKMHGKYPEHACSEAKEEYAAAFDEQLRNHHPRELDAPPDSVK